MKVLITGNEGYIGSVMSVYLESQGYDVFGRDVGYFSSIHTPSDDIRDISIKSLEGFDAIIYLSALSNDPLGEIKRSVTYDINWISAIKTAMLAREAGVKRFLFASSCSMYGAGNGDEFLDETSHQMPLTTYAESKVWAENGISSLASDGFSPVFFRCGTAYGVSPSQRLDLAVNSMVFNSYNNHKIIVYNGGVAWRPFVHVEDISQAFNLGLISPKNLVHNQAFNVGETGENFRIRDLANIIKNNTHYNSEIVYVGEDVDTRSYKVSFEKIKNVLGFESIWDVRRGITQFIYEFEDNGVDLYNRDSSCIRLNKIKELTDDGLLDEDLRWI